MSSSGIPFYKMSGSGNDFIFFDSRTDQSALDLESPEKIAELCRRGTGIGADGVVWLYTPAKDTGADLGIRYYNSDGSTASLCGNATLCTVNLGFRLGVPTQSPGEIKVATAAGMISGRIDESSHNPQFDLPTAQDLTADYTQIPPQNPEIRIGFVTAGIPHLVVLCENVDDIDIMKRGPELRFHPTLEAGANVNFVSKSADGSWKIRTYERGVEGETLACGTGNVATAILLKEWGLTGDQSVNLVTMSEKILTVAIKSINGAILPSLSGEGRVVFRGDMEDVD